MQAMDRFALLVGRICPGSTPKGRHAARRGGIPTPKLARGFLEALLRGECFAAWRAAALSLTAGLLLATSVSAQNGPIPGTLPPPGNALPAPAPGPTSETTPQAPAVGSPSRPLVSDIIIQGNRHLSAEYIKNLMTTRINKEFNPEVLGEDIRKLYATKYFGNVYADKRDAGLGRVVVVVYVKDHPTAIEKITYRGAVALSTDELNEITGLRVGMPCNPVANRVACENIVRRYHEEGRSLSSCKLAKGGQPGDTEVIFDITEGPKFRIAGILFTGNSFASDAMLRTHMQSGSKVLSLVGFSSLPESMKFQGLALGGTYNPAMLEYDRNELIRYYRAFGFHDVRIGQELRYTADGRGLIVVFHIQEGVRYQLDTTPHIYGVKSVSAELLEAGNKMKGNEFYNQAKVDADTARIRDALGTQGRESRVMAVPVFPTEKPGLVQVRYEVEERAPAKVGRIYIIGNDRTMQNVILRQVPLFPGQVLNFPAIRDGERNLQRLGIFESTPDGSVKPTINVLDNPLDPDNPYKDILVTVQEASTGSLMFGLGVNSDSGLTGSIVLNERNFDLFRIPRSFDDILNGTAFRGAGQELRVEAVPGTQLQRYVVSLREPFLFDSPYSLTVSGFYYQRSFNEYNEDRFGGRVSLGRKVNDLWSVVGTARVENVNVSGVADFAPIDYRSVVGDNFQAGFRLGAIRDSRDSVLRPTEGSLLDFGAEYVTGDRNFPLITAELTNYFTVWQRADNTGRHVLSIHNQIGWAGTTTPVFERYFAGGFRSIRGFAFRGVSPDVNGFKLGGDGLILNSIEYQLPVMANDQVSLVGFVDSGAVSRRINAIDDYRVSAGFGVRFVVPMLGPAPIALDFGFPIVKGPFDQRQVFNFFMGWSR